MIIFCIFVDDEINLPTYRWQTCKDTLVLSWGLSFRYFGLQARSNGPFMARFKGMFQLRYSLISNNFLFRLFLFKYIPWHCRHEFLRLLFSVRRQSTDPCPCTIIEGLPHNFVCRAFVCFWSWTAQREFGCIVRDQKVIKYHGTSLVCSITKQSEIIRWPYNASYWPFKCHEYSNKRAAKPAAGGLFEHVWHFNGNHHASACIMLVRYKTC